MRLYAGDRTMNKPKPVILVIILTLLWSVPLTRAQGNSVYFNQVESAITKREPKWKLESKRISKNSEMASFRWKTGKLSVGVLMIVYSSPEETVGRIEGLVSLCDLRVLETKVNSLGNNLLWESKSDRGRGVMFTKGRFVVSVDSDSTETAISFAEYIAATLLAA